MESVWMGTRVGIIYGLLCWDDENEIGERVWMGLEIESVEMVLPVWIMTGAGFLLKLTLLEAESDSY